MILGRVIKVTAAILALLLLGFLITRLSVRSAPAEACVAAEVALLLDNPIDRLILRTGASVSMSSGSSSIVTVYALFRVPYAKLEIDCKNGGSGHVVWRIIG